MGEVAVFNLTLDGNEIKTIVKDRQIHPVTRAYIHVDFMELHRDKEITVSVPFKFIGTPASLKEGGVLEIGMRELKVSCLPKHIPDDIPIEIEQIKIGETLYIKDLKLENISIKDVANLPILSVSAKKSE
jgi:large subunit ribosomal protein L25